jgi:malonyl-CoA/methylmalonyl-CoA synthetase
MNQNFFSLVESRFPDDRTLCCLETADGISYSWLDLDRTTARFANLLEELNLPSGARIAVQVEKSPEALFLYLAVLRAGHVYIPLNTAYRQLEVEYFLNNAQPAVLIGTPANLPWVSRIAKGAVIKRVFTLGTQCDGTLLEGAVDQPDTYRTVQRESDSLAVIIYTSGTTGRSKGAMLTHGNIASNALTLHRFWGWSADDILIHALPIFHVHGLFISTHCALLGGTKILWFPKFDAKAVVNRLPEGSVFMGVPTYYSRLLAEPALAEESCRHMRLFVSGSAPLPPPIFEKFRARTGHVIVERYGMSETNVICSNPWDPKLGARAPGTVGVAIPEVSIRVVDDDGRPCPAGKIGHLQVKGPNVFRGYWRSPEASQAAFTPDGWFRTGDIGRFGVDMLGKELPASYLTLVGRSRDLIITGGYNVYPKEIEGFIDELPGVAESAVVGVPDHDFGEAVVAAVVPKPGAKLDEAGMIRTLKTQIARFKVPKRIHFVKELPRNVMGKVQKEVLRASMESESSQ